MTTTVFLVLLVFHGPGNGSTRYLYPMKDMATCLESVKTSQTSIANGGDSEGAVSLFCVNGAEVIK